MVTKWARHMKSGGLPTLLPFVPVCTRSPRVAASGHTRDSRRPQEAGGGGPDPQCSFCGMSEVESSASNAVKRAFRFFSRSENQGFGPFLARLGPGKAWKMPPVWAPIDLHRFSARQTNSKDISCGFSNPV